MTIVAGKFKFEQLIGKGSYADVYLALMVVDDPPLKKGDHVAIKSIPTTRISSQQEYERLENEIQLMKMIDHPNIVKLYNVEKTKSYYFLVMEYCSGGDLMHALHKNKGSFDEPTIREFAKQIVSGLSFLNSKQIIHRDLKPHNILISENKELKIADFGFAKLLKPCDLATTICGSPIYMAPEIQFGSQYSANADMWSLGVILYELCVGTPPFSPNATTIVALERELEEHSSEPYMIPNGVKASPSFRDLVSKLLTIDPKKRICINDVIVHPFFNEQSTSKKQFKPEKCHLSSSQDRIWQFSFLQLGNVIGNKAELFLKEALESAKVIEAHFTECQMSDVYQHFELITIISSLMLDFLSEYRHTATDRKLNLEREVIDNMKNFAEEGLIISKGKLYSPKESAFQFLYDKGLQYTREGADLEKKCDPFAATKYQRALSMFRPIAFRSDTNDFINSVRVLYQNVLERYQKLTGYTE